MGYSIGAFNSSGESVRQLNRSHMWATRVFFNPLGEYNISEGSSDAGDSPVLHLGFAARGGEPIRGRSRLEVFRDTDNQSAMDVEFAFKSRRLYSTAEFFWMTDEQQNPVSGRDIDSNGFHAQLSFMPVAPLLEVGVRYSEISPDTQVDGAQLQEVRAVANYYWRAHNLKVQGDVGQVIYGESFGSLSSTARAGLPSIGNRLVRGQRLSDTEFRLQFQLLF